MVWPPAPPRGMMDTLYRITQRQKDGRQWHPSLPHDRRRCLTHDRWFWHGFLFLDLPPHRWNFWVILTDGKSSSFSLPKGLLHWLRGWQGHCPSKPRVCNNRKIDLGWSGFSHARPNGFSTTYSRDVRRWLDGQNVLVLRRAGSKISGLLVAAKMIIPSLASKTIHFYKSWFKVCSLSSWPPPTPASLTTDSINFINKDDTRAIFWLVQRSRTQDALTPTNISTKSDPLMVKKATITPATALTEGSSLSWRAIRRTPFGILAPMALNFLGFSKIQRFLPILLWPHRHRQHR